MSAIRSAVTRAFCFAAAAVWWGLRAETAYRDEALMRMSPLYYQETYADERALSPRNEAQPKRYTISQTERLSDDRMPRTRRRRKNTKTMMINILYNARMR